MRVSDIQSHHLHPNQLLSDTGNFMMRIEALLQRLCLDLKGVKLDHVALRINEQPLAQQLDTEWRKCGTVISATNINGRPIIIFKLHEELGLSSWVTDCVEFPYPKDGKHYPSEGWEHVEFVIPSIATTASDYLEDLYRQFPSLQQKIEEMKECGLVMKLSAPQGDKERLANPTVAFKWRNVCVKLHPHSIEEIISSESD